MIDVGIEQAKHFRGSQRVHPSINRNVRFLRLPCWRKISPAKSEIFLLGEYGNIKVQSITSQTDRLQVQKTRNKRHFQVHKVERNIE